MNLLWTIFVNYLCLYREFTVFGKKLFSSYLQSPVWRFRLIIPHRCCHIKMCLKAVLFSALISITLVFCIAFHWFTECRRTNLYFSALRLLNVSFTHSLACQLGPKKEQWAQQQIRWWQSPRSLPLASGEQLLWASTESLITRTAGEPDLCAHSYYIWTAFNHRAVSSCFA